MSIIQWKFKVRQASKEFCLKVYINRRWKSKGNERLKGLNTDLEALTHLPECKLSKLKHVSQFKDLDSEITSDSEEDV